MKKILIALNFLSLTTAFASEPLSTQDIATLQKRLGSINFELKGKSAEIVGRKISEEPQARECILSLTKGEATGRILLSLETEGFTGQIFEFNDAKTQIKTPTPAKISSESPKLITLKADTSTDTHDDQTGRDTGSITVHSGGFIAFDQQGKVRAAQFSSSMVVTCVFAQ